ncbi:hypothetical protein niasHT_012117 [Heterodera trifolii]|uniref:Glutathione synthetase n=1 Tax=Heterodera trifolii TaxID=157864 RepID=A0ABD2LA67_9BILA
MHQIFLTISFLLIIGSAISNGTDEVKRVEISLQDLVEDAINWAHHIGLAWRADKKFPRSDTCVFVPFTLFPSPFPRKIYNEALEIQKAMQLLYFRVSNDFDFLTKTLEPVAATDVTIRSWLKLYREVHSLPIISQPLTLVLTRSDYMCHLSKSNGTDEEEYQLKQVEVNIGQMGGPAIANRTTIIHRQMLAKVGYEAANLPDNDAEGIVAKGLYQAWMAFGVDDAIVVVVARRASRNIEQFQLEVRLEQLSGNKIQIVKLSIDECDDQLFLDPKDNSLRYNGQLVAVVYYKTIIVNPALKSYNARLKIEKSTAIKSPTISLELACAKKVQQALSEPGVLEHFFPEPEYAQMVNDIRKTFAKMWSLDQENDEIMKIISDAIENPGNYVLKPSQEGGGNNFWNEEIAKKLRTFKPKERAAHILMERLRPLVVKNFMVRPYVLEVPQLSNIVSELSIYGYLLGNSTNMAVLRNERDGYMLRSKREDDTEGGIHAGGGVHDSPYLF